MKSPLFRWALEPDSMPAIAFRVFTIVVLVWLVLCSGYLQAQSSKTVDQAYPYLATYALPYAVLTNLTPGILLVSDKVIIKEAGILSEIRRSHRTLHAQLKKPDLIFYDQQGQEIGRHVEFLPEREIEEKLKQFGLI